MDQALQSEYSAALKDRACPSCASGGLIQMSYPSSEPQWRTLDVLVCPSCGLGFVPKVTFDLNTYYEQSYGGSHNRGTLKPRFFKNIDNKTGKKVARARWHAEMLNERFGAFDRVLDIGSGPGFFLHYINAKAKFAIESDRHSQEMLKAVDARVVNAPTDVEDLDLIVMSHVLEHFLVDEYQAYLQTLMSRLRPSGLLLIEVPQWGFLHKKFERDGGKGHEPHTMFFSPRSLLKSVEAELVYFHDKRTAYAVTAEGVDWKTTVPKGCPISSMMAIWRKA